MEGDEGLQGLFGNGPGVGVWRDRQELVMVIGEEAGREVVKRSHLFERALH